jgi:excisionase family DNA binding protein
LDAATLIWSATYSMRQRRGVTPWLAKLGCTHLASIRVDAMTEREEVLTVDEVAEWLKVNELTVRNWIDRGQLRALRAGQRRVRLRRSDVEAFVDPHQGTAEQARTSSFRCLRLVRDPGVGAAYPAMFQMTC